MISGLAAVVHPRANSAIEWDDSALARFGTDNDFSNSSAIFANQVITLYTQSIGSWSYLIISISGFSIMFGTCIAVLDGYARSAKECFRLTFQRENKIPYFGICFGMQLAVIEMARNILGIKEANSSVFADCKLFFV